MSSVNKKLLKQGNGQDYPKPGDEVTIEYTGWLQDLSASSNNNKGKQFDSSVGRGDFKTQIGTGRVIPGWDQGVPQMSLGEKSTLTIPGQLAYGARLVNPSTQLKEPISNESCHLKQSYLHGRGLEKL
ncbi:hypothetical protein LTR84_012646 [Exophiala bonariae]|uniref:peptidylprolyl isomerase n=1 Tax=Exophiala bonariae TaxID=1690606 RepID=A0AAV9NGU7_9EURO|nr:hypothetical protein LTR84_012646 [Exophiala bonariae]